MFKKILICALPMILAACSSTSVNWQQDESKETIYQKTNNHTQLVTLYKSQLKRKDSDLVREKLAKSYLALGDTESALLFIAPVVQHTEPTVNSLLIQAQIFAELGQYPAAIASAKRVLDIEPENAQAENQLGTYYGYNYQFDLARRYFERSRAHYYDSVTVNNNLAVLDIAQGHYNQAMKRLLPLYKNGQADEQVMANLTLSMAKEGQYQFVYQVLKEKYSKYQVEQIYRSLQKYHSLDAESRTLSLTSQYDNGMSNES